MSETNNRVEANDVAPDLEKRLERVEKDLDVMERHAAELDETEDELKSYMKKVDREHKDSHFHSVPKPKKHTL
ncbi:hypothetical protein L9S41_07395 [Geoalkalibacter halelectricus]|uniref:SlyX protein n=1 Tax=Geoalkalibacter halelectricus TaxID=2847045 RepID=A0ABY5ZQU0_9BACT|nr:hypothetical protein [Geoalkalibacter halelectricus]UWZ81204.1 hypothetical protein L9S41_07395 [Geoalkalibacter halelectricus]